MRNPYDLRRRKLLQFLGQGILLAPFASLQSCGGGAGSSSPPPGGGGGNPYQGTDEQLLDAIQQGAFQFFWNETNPSTGQIKDRALLNGHDTRTMSSIAATGFGLSSLCIGDARGYGKTADIVTRVRNTLSFLYNSMPHVHGFYYHFVDMNTGQRVGTSEVSSIDTSILLCGVLMARAYFQDAQIEDLATKIYNRVEWPWMLNGGPAFSMGWQPESGFLNNRWDHYCELMMIYLLGIGSPTNPVSSDTWTAWSRPTITFQGLTYISGNDPLFTHQYSHAWFDFRNKKDAYANYFDNSVTATKAHKLFCLSLASQFNDYSDNLWGITASDYAGGYTAWGGPPPQGPIDGSVVPCATGGSLPFVYADCIRVLRTIRTTYAAKAWGLYGFVDAFNPLTGWYDADVLGIDLGITMLMAENQRSGLVWNTFMKNAEPVAAMQKVGFQPA
jgi:hypothetical protein